MPAIPRLVRTSITVLLAAASLASAALAQEKPAPVSTVGPPASLSAEQTLALQAKRAADPGLRQPLLPISRPEKLVGSPRLVSRVVFSTPEGMTSVPGKPWNISSSRCAPVGRESWKSLSSVLGPIPRPEWSARWSPAKPADVTISRPLRQTDATSPSSAKPGSAGLR